MITCMRRAQATDVMSRFSSGDDESVIYIRHDTPFIMCYTDLPTFTFIQLILNTFFLQINILNT